MAFTNPPSQARKCLSKQTVSDQPTQRLEPGCLHYKPNRTPFPSYYSTTEKEKNIMASATDFGVQSFCFRSIKDNAQVAAQVREIGLNKIEVCAVHADFNDVEAWKEIVKTYQDAGVSIVSIGVQTFNGDIEKERQWFECAKIAGAKYISAHFKVDTFQTAVPAVAKLCKEYGIKIAIHRQSVDIAFAWRCHLPALNL